ncbi:hypothetical protein PspLS_09403 [Pyricularia sp. CBS 133598]|nr:hypothetical protein PspLS_09403 [Pyricularia sp. CBS 133598]
MPKKMPCFCTIRLSVWSSIWIFGVVCDAVGTFNLARGPAPLSPPAEENIDPNDWVHYQSFIPYTGPLLKPVEAGYFAHLAWLDMQQSHGLSNKKAPGAMIVIQDAKGFTLDTSVKSKSAAQGRYYKKIDLSVTDSVDQALQTMEGETRYAKGHWKNAVCAEYAAFRYYDQRNRPAGQNRFHWPDRSGTVIQAGGRYGHLPPCTINPQFDADGNPTCYFGCKDFLHFKEYPILSDQQDEVLRAQVKALVEKGPEHAKQFLAKFGLTPGESCTLQKRGLDKRECNGRTAPRPGRQATRRPAVANAGVTKSRTKNTASKQNSPVAAQALPGNRASAQVSKVKSPAAQTLPGNRASAQAGTVKSPAAPALPGNQGSGRSAQAGAGRAVGTVAQTSPSGLTAKSRAALRRRWVTL